MKHYYLPMLLAIGGGVLYHVAQKAVPKEAHPFAVILGAYCLGSVACLLMLWFDPARPVWGAVWQSGRWATLGIGLGAVMIEAGILLSYRAGWNLGAASVVLNGAVALLLLPLGLVLFRERLSFQTILGMICCLVGLVLLSKK